MLKHINISEKIMRVASFLSKQCFRFGLITFLLLISGKFLSHLRPFCNFINRWKKIQICGFFMESSVQPLPAELF